MNTAEATALRGLMLLLVEVQNLVRTATSARTALDAINAIGPLVESDHAREHIQLARAVLERAAPRTGCTCPVNGASSTCLAHGDAEHRRDRPAAIPAAHASVHV